MMFPSEVTLHSFSDVTHSMTTLASEGIFASPPSSFDILVSLIEHHSIFQTHSQTPQLPVPYQLAIALYRFGHFGSVVSVEAVAQWAGCSAGAVVKATRRIMIAIIPLHEQAIHWPNSDEK